MNQLSRKKNEAFRNSDILQDFPSNPKHDHDIIHIPNQKCVWPLLWRRKTVVKLVGLYIFRLIRGKYDHVPMLPQLYLSSSTL